MRRTGSGGFAWSSRARRMRRGLIPLTKFEGREGRHLVCVRAALNPSSACLDISRLPVRAAPTARSSRRRPFVPSAQKYERSADVVDANPLIVSKLAWYVAEE